MSRPSARLIRAGVAVAVVGALVAACGGSGGGGGGGQTDGVSATEIRVGGLVALTGPLGNAYKGISEGVRAYFDLVNSQGGVNGRKLTLARVRDDGTNISRSTSQAIALVEQDHVFAVVGASSPIFPAGRYLAQKGIPTFGTNFNVEWNSGPSLFGHNGSYNDYKAALPFLPWLAKKVGATTAATIAYTVASSADCSDGEANSFKKFGITVGLQDNSLQFGTTDITADIQRMKEQHVQFVATCMDPTGNTLVSKGLKKANLNNVVQYWPNGYDPDTLKSFADLMEGVYFGLQHVPFESAAQSPAMQTFLAQMHKVFPNSQVGEEALDGWMNADLFVTGLRAVGRDVTRKKLVDAINKIRNYSAGGLVPPIDWTRQHTGPNPNADCTAVVQVQRGQFVPVFGTGGTPFVCFHAPRADTLDNVPPPPELTGRA